MKFKLNYNNYVCECGCGELVPYGNRFIYGHNLFSKFGDENPMRNPEIAKQSGLSRRGQLASWAEGENSCMKNSAVLDKCSKAKKGKTLLELGRKPDCGCPVCKCSRGELKGEEHPSHGHVLTEEICERIGILNSVNTTKSWQDPEFISKQMKARGVTPNKTELNLQDILDDLFPGQYQFIGDGQLIIGGKCPDFVHILRNN